MRRRLSSDVWLTLFACVCASWARAFNFSSTIPTQCDDVEITWTGGTPPFSLLLTRIFAPSINFSIPESAFNNNQGVFHTQVALPQGQAMLLTMSDATGFGTGGTSAVYTVGPPVGGVVCNTTIPHPEFTFAFQSNNDPPEVCKPYRFWAYQGAVQPVQIYGLIPSGKSFVMNPPVSSANSTNWQTNVAAGTSVVFAMYDSIGNQGGSSNVEVVVASDTTSCLTTEGTKLYLSTGSVAIISIIGLLVLLSLGVYLRRRRRRRSHAYIQTPIDPLTQDFIGGHSLSYLPPTRFELQPPQSDTHSSDSTRLQHYLPNPFELQQQSGNMLRSSLQSKSSAASTQEPIAGSSHDLLTNNSTTPMTPGFPPPTPRILIHTDYEDPAPNEDGVIELPPQYTDRRESQAPPQLRGSPASRRRDEKLRRPLV